MSTDLMEDRMPYMSRALESKVILIVGGTSGMGLSAAKACVNAGARVVCVGREESVDAARDVLRGGARVIAGDAVDPAASERAVALAMQEFGALDGLYHVAGGSGRKWGDGPLHELSDAGWQETIDLNATSVMNSNRAAVREFLKSGSGSILNMTSVLAYAPSPEHFSTHAYAASKAAVIGLTRSCAAYYAGKNIRFNAIAPGLVETPMAQRAVNDATIAEFVTTKQQLDGGRVGRAEDLDAAAVFFLSDGSKFVTGQVLGVDGGWAVSG